MKILKYLFFLILIIFIGSAIFFGTKDGSYNIKDSLVIEGPPEVAFSIVNDYKTWEKWGPWKKEDPTMTFTYAEKTVGEGASYSWEGEMSGAMTTTKVIPNKEIEQDLMLKTPAGERNPKVYWLFEEVPNGTKVSWGMKGEHPLIDKAYYTLSGFDFEAAMHQMNTAGLEGIAKEVEEEMKRYSINVDGVTQYGGGYYMYMASVSKLGELNDKTKQMMNEVMSFVTENNLNMAGKPFSLYNEIDSVNGTVIFSTCIPVKEQVITPKGSSVVCGFMDPVRAVKISLKGNYEHLPEAYTKGNQYIEKNGYELATDRKMFEVYITDPEKVANPANWLTEVYLPIINSVETTEEEL